MNAPIHLQPVQSNLSPLGPDWRPGITKWCILFIKDGQEQKSPWFYSLDRCKAAFEVIKAKYGSRSLIYMD